MNPSLFVSFVSMFWPKLALYITTKLDNEPQKKKYYHKEMLRPVYSDDGKWESTSANSVYVAADVVALDSPLPLKSRGSMGKSSGEIPKVGMRKQKTEKNLDTIFKMIDRYSAMRSSNDDTIKGQAAGQKDRIIQQFADDATACSVGIDEKNEANFLYGLSNGVVAIEDEDNIGTALRVDYGYDQFPSHHFGVEVLDTISKDDIERVFQQANDDGNSIGVIYMSRSLYRKMKKERWACELVASDEGKVFRPEDVLPVPSEKRFDEAFASEFGDVEIVKVNRTVTFEKNGKPYNKRPFNENKMIFLPSKEVGALVWAVPVESRAPVAGVKYSTVDNFKLISKYSTNDPVLAETTAGQALVIPVIENVNTIYSIDAKNAFTVDAEAEKQDAGDEFITVDGKKYNKPAVIAALNEMGVKTQAKASDDTVMKKINSLNDEQEAELLSKLSPVL